jgi:anti-sigma B factor antagonist
LSSKSPSADIGSTVSAWRFAAGGRAARTDVFVVDTFQHFDYIRVFTHTGRTHQIRVHMAHVGNPLLGDLLYGGRRSRGAGTQARAKTTFERLMKILPRHALHATRLSFTHPELDTRMTFTSALPGDMRARDGANPSYGSRARDAGMKITQRQNQGAVILDLNGKLTGGPDADVFRKLFEGLIEQGKKQIVVNLEKVSWINSTGLGILITTTAPVRSAGGDLVVMGASERIESILYVTKLNLLFKSFENEEDAVKSFTQVSH